MFGKIIDGKLQIAGSVITNKDGGTTTNPTTEQLIELGYKEIEYAEKPEYDKEEMKLYETYTEYNDKIIVAYATIELTDEEHNEIIKQEIIEEENKITPRRQREIDLNKEGALEFAQQIDNNIIALRAKIRPIVQVEIENGQEE